MFQNQMTIAWLLRVIGSAEVTQCGTEGNIQCLKTVVHPIRLYKGIVFPLRIFSQSTEDLSLFFILPCSAFRNSFSSSSMQICQNSTYGVKKLIEKKLKRSCNVRSVKDELSKMQHNLKQDWNALLEYSFLQV